MEVYALLWVTVGSVVVLGPCCVQVPEPEPRENFCNVVPFVLPTVPVGKFPSSFLECPRSKNSHHTNDRGQACATVSVSIIVKVG
jgi:hypothetical protein